LWKTGLGFPVKQADGLSATFHYDVHIQLFMEREAPLFRFHGLSMSGVFYASNSNIGQAENQLHSTRHSRMVAFVDSVADFLGSYVAYSPGSIVLYNFCYRTAPDGNSLFSGHLYFKKKTLQVDCNGFCFFLWIK